MGCPAPRGERQVTHCRRPAQQCAPLCAPARVAPALPCPGRGRGCSVSTWTALPAPTAHSGSRVGHLAPESGLLGLLLPTPTRPPSASSSSSIRRSWTLAHCLDTPSLLSSPRLAGCLSPPRSPSRVHGLSAPLPLHLLWSSAGQPQPHANTLVCLPLPFSQSFLSAHPLSFHLCLSPKDPMRVTWALGLPGLRGHLARLSRLPLLVPLFPASSLASAL